MAKKRNNFITQWREKFVPFLILHKKTVKTIECKKPLISNFLQWLQKLGRTLHESLISSIIKISYGSHHPIMRIKSDHFTLSLRVFGAKAPVQSIHPPTQMSGKMKLKFPKFAFPLGVELFHSF